jgi:hypothetical protein
MLNIQTFKTPITTNLILGRPEKTPVTKVVLAITQKINHEFNIEFKEVKDLICFLETIAHIYKR